MALRERVPIDVPERIISAEALWALSKKPEYAGRVYELSEGVMIEMSRPGGLHGLIQGEAYFHLRSFVGPRRLGYLTVESGYILGKKPNGRDTVRGPDVAFVRLERAPDGLPSGYVPFPPDLAIEVVSPNDLANEIESKVLDLLAAGVALVWVIYANTRNVIERRLGGRSAVYTEVDTLDAGDVLPGFTLPVAALFPDKMLPEPEVDDEDDEA
jgi:Uma2 family endonuclease